MERFHAPLNPKPVDYRISDFEACCFNSGYWASGLLLSSFGQVEAAGLGPLSMILFGDTTQGLLCSTFFGLVRVFW